MWPGDLVQVVLVLSIPDLMFLLLCLKAGSSSSSVVETTFPGVAVRAGSCLICFATLLQTVSVNSWSGSGDPGVCPFFWKHGPYGWQGGSQHPFPILLWHLPLQLGLTSGLLVLAMMPWVHPETALSLIRSYCILFTGAFLLLPAILVLFAGVAVIAPPLAFLFLVEHRQKVLVKKQKEQRCLMRAGHFQSDEKTAAAKHCSSVCKNHGKNDKRLPWSRYLFGKLRLNLQPNERKFTIINRIA